MKNLSTTFAFIIAVSSAFLFTPVKGEGNFILTRGLDHNCPLGWVSEDCLEIATGTICTFQLGFVSYLAVSDKTPNCLEAQVLKRL